MAGDGQESTIAWKVTEPDVLLYGEDIYGGAQHRVRAGSRERNLPRVSPSRDADGTSRSMADVERFAAEHGIPIVPVLRRGVFDSLAVLRDFVRREHRKPSVLGGEREGVVIRSADGFSSSDFARNVCKSVRPHHVRTDQHWTRNWRPCAIQTG